MRVVLNVFGLKRLNYFRVMIALILLSGLLLTPLQAPVHAQRAGCSTSSPVWDAYAVTVCITSPADKTILSRQASVTATVSVLGANPGVQKLLFYLDGRYLLTHYTTPYTFTLPTMKFVDGSRLLEVEAIMRDGFTSARAAIDLTFNNGITQPPVNTDTYTLARGSMPQPGRPFILAATGDGASGEPNAEAVTDLIASWDPNMLLYLGDVYDKGTSTEFHNWYGTGSEHYARFRAITNPTVGNHEYDGDQAPGYFDYWNNVPHYYSLDVAGWHVISLDSTGQFGQTSPGTSQYDWLVADLEANPAACTIAYFHHPVYNIGPEGEATRINQIWALLAQHGVDVVLTGHDHDYQRWYALDGLGNLDPNGMTQFVVGTGGHGIQDFIRTDPRVAVGFDTSPHAFGALRLELNQSGAAYQFVNIEGATLDSGSIPCSTSPDTLPPNAPTNLTATSSASTHVELNWASATDDVGVTNYEIYRDGALLATIGAVTNYADNTVTGGTTYQYRVRARDAAGKVSPSSSSAAITASELLFRDGFESGSFSEWTTVVGLVIQSKDVRMGRYAVRGTSHDEPTYAYKQLSQGRKELYYRLSFKIISQGTNTVYLQRFRTGKNSAILGIFVSNTGKLGFRNDVTGTNTTSSTIVTPNTWHEIQTHVLINGTASQVEIWLDDVRISALSTTEDLGTTEISRIQLGDSSRGRIYDIALDQVALSTQFVDSLASSQSTSLPFLSKKEWVSP